MEGEYIEEKEVHHNINNNPMFPKLHQTQTYLTTTSVQHHNFQLDVVQQTSEETTNKRELSATNDGGSIENIRRPRGRPPGSKNKPKPPVIITRDSQLPTMSPYVLEIPADSDVIASVTSFCMRRCSGLCILNGSGSVANVTLKQPSTTSGATVTFHGRFDMLSISGTILPSLHINNILSVHLAGPQGQIVGGAVVGPLVAVGTVYVVAASFNNPTYHRLSVEEGRGGGGDEVGSPPSVGGVSGGGGGGGGGDSEQAPPSDGGGMGVYGGGQLNSDVISGASGVGRQQHPPY